MLVFLSNVTQPSVTHLSHGLDLFDFNVGIGNFWLIEATYYAWDESA